MGKTHFRKAGDDVTGGKKRPTLQVEYVFTSKLVCHLLLRVVRPFEFFRIQVRFLRNSRPITYRHFDVKKWLSKTKSSGEVLSFISEASVFIQKLQKTFKVPIMTSKVV